MYAAETRPSRAWWTWPRRSRRHAARAGDGEGPRGNQGAAPLGRARDGHGGAGAVSRNQAGPRPGHRCWIFTIFLAKSPSPPDDLAAIEAKMAK